MMEILDANAVGEFETFNSEHPCGHFMQSAQWAQLKREWGREVVVSRNAEGKIVGGMSVLVRKMPLFGRTMLYIGRGPVAAPDDFATLEDLFKSIPVLAKKHKAYIFKMDPPVPKSNEAFIDFMVAQGFRQPSDDAHFKGVQSRFVFLLNLAGKTEEEVFASFHPKTRYNIRLAQKRGVEVKLCGPEACEDFARIMHTTGARDGFIVRPQAYFERMLGAMGEHARLYMAYFEGEPIAGALPIQYGDKTWYLYGASDNAHRNCMPNYLLQWEMIRWAVEGGSRLYDFRGVSGGLNESDILPGLYKFKKGFNGDFTEFAGEFNLVISPFFEQLIHTALRVRSGLMRKG
ncbi:MAG: aminoacyltransferase [Oscillospiraceae bacterium]|jgi:lipid II:glycine glycyltransferase (peptidoglycan interpeptide bridge formation enzyme)|nr:aminoacyltransferase [Oscillospiraceae bacterium]